ncbi:MAG: hypothetical protein LBL84_03950 [Candidatus Nomurabacteria bacterium]|jgi:ssDNA-binding Zn-finger/Zn-ribbon topoisomerase 1|nr:hypothetical protein [Candidatus Nomurabacteria bacterium]
MVLEDDNLVERLQRDFKNVTFKLAKDFAWQPKNHTIRYNTTDKHWRQLLLHEIGHSELKHQSYQSDVELLKFEAQAWDYAKKQLATKYQVELDDDFIEDRKDSYRDWLYRRSRCPQCEYGGWQTGDNQYKCPNCLRTWQVNSDKFKRVHRKLHKK